MPEVPSEALEAGDAALRDYLDNFPGWKPRGEAEVLIEAAYPHIRRAIIEELIAQFEAEAKALPDSMHPHYARRYHAIDLLRNELAKEDDQ